MYSINKPLNMEIMSLPSDIITNLVTFVDIVVLVMLKFVNKTLGKIVNEFSKEHNIKGNSIYFDVLVEKGYTDQLKFLWNELKYDFVKMQNNKIRIIDKAACCGHIGIIQWAQQIGCNYSALTMGHASLGGQLETIKWLYANGCTIDSHVDRFACQLGHINILEWMRLTGKKISNEAIQAAAVGGQLETLKWIKLKGYELPKDIITHAAFSGHIETIKYLRENNFSWDALTSIKAANYGHAKLLEYLYENGCPCDFKQIMDVSSGKYKDIIAFAQKNMKN